MTMDQSNRPSGRKKRVTSGGGNAARRGSGLGAGPVGSGARPASGKKRGAAANNRNTGDILSTVVGAAVGGSGKKRSGGLSKLIVLAVIVVALVLVYKSCIAGNDGTSSVLGGLLDSATGTDSSDLMGSLLGGTTESTQSSTENTTNSSDYAAHAADMTVDGAARTRYTAVRGSGKDVVTLMVYMCGTDLESQNGMATADLQEMVHATVGDNVNLIVETGGASSWNNSVISSKTNQIYQITSQGLVALEKNVGRKSMVDSDTLSTFIQYCEANFPADRYALVLWDHGGGSITGYGYDEYDPNDSMTLDELDAALKTAGCKFDFIGFDACLMATLETALVAEQYADYLIASEATEPGCGWYYTDWLTKLSANTSMPTVEIGKNIIDDFVTVCKKVSPSSKATLSLVDLAELSGTVSKRFTAFANAIGTMLDSKDYQTVATARSNARDFSSSSKINQIDLIHFAENLGTEPALALSNALRGCVKYNRICTSMTNANGVSIYFPYQSLGRVSSAISTYDKIGMDDEYTACIRSFASLAAGGQVVGSTTNTSASLLDVLLGGTSTDTASGSASSAIPSMLSSLLGDSSSTSDVGASIGSSLLGSLFGDDSASSSSGLDADTVATLLSLFLKSKETPTAGQDGFTAADIADWFDSDRAMASADYLAENRLSDADVAYTQKDGGRVLSLSETQWALVKGIALSVFLDDGAGYIDLGLDNTLEYDQDGDLIVDYDGTWIALNGQIVSYYLVSEETDGDNYCYTGRVPAMLNGQRVDIQIVFDNDNPDGTVVGAISDYQGLTDVVAKVDTEIQPGDEIDFLCDYYAYDGTYSDSYYLGERLIAPTVWEVSNVSVGSDYHYSMMLRITDLYGNYFWTAAVTE